jgi:hypothetical protein
MFFVLAARNGGHFFGRQGKKLRRSRCGDEAGPEARSADEGLRIGARAVRQHTEEP